MADAFSAYYLTHGRGAALNKKRVAKFLQVFFQIGDCASTNPGHHGTPIQQNRAAQFGGAEREAGSGCSRPSVALPTVTIRAS